MQYTSESVEVLVEQFAQLPTIGRKTARRLASYVLKMPREQVEALADALVAVKDQVRRCSVCYNVTEQDPCSICASPRRDHSTVCVVEEPSDVQAIERTGEYRGLYHVLGGAISPLDGIGPDDLRVRELAERVDPSFKDTAAGTSSDAGTPSDRETSPESTAAANGTLASNGSSDSKDPSAPADLTVHEPAPDYTETTNEEPRNEEHSPFSEKSPSDITASAETASEEQRVPIEEIILAVNPNVEGDTTAYYLSQLLEPMGVKVTRIARGLPIGGDLEYADEATLARALEGRGKV